jgi:hypothetical protein
MQMVQKNMMASVTATDKTALLGGGGETETSRIVHGLRRTDSALLDELIGEYKRPLMKYLLSLTRRQDVAEDIFQERWMRVILKGINISGKLHFKHGSFASPATLQSIFSGGVFTLASNQSTLKNMSIFYLTAVLRLSARTNSAKSLNGGTSYSRFWAIYRHAIARSCS